MTLTIIEEGSCLVRVSDELGNEFWVPRERLTRKKPTPRGNNSSRPIIVSEISEALLEHIRRDGVDIRIMAAPEHKETLERMLRLVGSSLPTSFECVAVGDNGGTTRPYAPGFVCVFKTPPDGTTLIRFRDEGNGNVSTASTAFALSLIKHGFPITIWKGKP